MEFQSLHTYTADIELDEALILIAADEAEHVENAKLGLMFRATSAARWQCDSGDTCSERSPDRGLAPQETPLWCRVAGCLACSSC